MKGSWFYIRSPKTTSILLCNHPSQHEPWVPSLNQTQQSWHFNLSELGHLYWEGPNLWHLKHSMLALVKGCLPPGPLPLVYPRPLPPIISPLVTLRVCSSLLTFGYSAHVQAMSSTIHRVIYILWLFYGANYIIEFLCQSA